VNEHDLHGRALLIVVGRDEQRLIEPERKGEHGRDHEPGEHAFGKRVEARRVGKFGQAHDCLPVFLLRTAPPSGNAAECARP
jgi:hypothetical protein